MYMHRCVQGWGSVSVRRGGLWASGSYGQVPAEVRQGCRGNYKIDHSSPSPPSKGIHAVYVYMYIHVFSNTRPSFWIGPSAVFESAVSISAAGHMYMYVCMCYRVCLCLCLLGIYVQPFCWWGLEAWSSIRLPDLAIHNRNSSISPSQLTNYTSDSKILRQPSFKIM